MLMKITIVVIINIENILSGINMLDDFSFMVSY